METQGKLFDRMQEFHAGMDTKYFIDTYMKSRTRAFIDVGQPYVCTMDSEELWGYLSNWYISDFKVKGVAYNSMEQYMMHQKAMVFCDAKVAYEILQTNDVAKIKGLGYWS